MRRLMTVFLFVVGVFALSFWVYRLPTDAPFVIQTIARSALKFSALLCITVVLVSRYKDHVDQRTLQHDVLLLEKFVRWAVISSVVAATLLLYSFLLPPQLVVTVVLLIATWLIVRHSWNGLWS